MRGRWNDRNNPRDYPKFWVGITGLKNSIVDPNNSNSMENKDQQTPVVQCFHVNITSM